MSNTQAQKMDGAHCFYLKWLKNSGLTESEIKKLLENFVQDFVIKENNSLLQQISHNEINNNFMENNMNIDHEMTNNEENVSTWLDNLLDNNGSTWKTLIMNIFKENSEYDRLKVLVSNIYKKEGKRLCHPSIVCTTSDIYIETIINMILCSIKNGSILELGEIAAYSPFSYLTVQCILRKIIPKIDSTNSLLISMLNRISIEVHEYVHKKCNHECLHQMDLVLNSVHHFNTDEEQQVSMIYFTILQNGSFTVDMIEKIHNYLQQNYNSRLDANSLLHDICSNRFLSKKLVEELFTHLETHERDNNHQLIELLTKTISLLVFICNNNNNNNNNDITNSNNDVIHSTETDKDHITIINSLECIEKYFTDTTHLLRKLSESELNIIRFEDISKSLENPLKISSIAYGFMVWFQHNLSIKNFSDATAITTMPYFFLLFDTIINLHMPILHNEMMKVLKSILFMTFDHVEALTEFKLKKCCMSAILFLMVHDGMMPEVYQVISTYKNSSTDTSLLFYFIRKFLKIIRPPFSTEFNKLWGPFLNSDDIQSGLRANEKESLNFFLKHMA